ncbi:hypothetical protein ABTY63_29905 [Streptomyces solisilvae]|uniref:hypothetical protein n=1 Tax=Streptomyces malaysiensis TaxID=92644 RepID=UPI00332A1F83
MARFMWDANDLHSPTVRNLIMAARNRESYDVDWDSTEGSWGVIDGRGAFVEHTGSREAARIAARRRGAKGEL